MPVSLLNHPLMGWSALTLAASLFHCTTAVLYRIIVRPVRIRELGKTFGCFQLHWEYVCNSKCTLEWAESSCGLAGNVQLSMIKRCDPIHVFARPLSNFPVSLVPLGV